MKEFALQYAARSWPVFPVTGWKTPFKGSHGHLDANTDAATIEAWWQKRPRANIALRCGAIVVIDLDGPGAVRQWQEMRDAAGWQGRTLTAQTSRGYHLYFAAPAGVTIRTRNAKRDKAGGDGIDVKGDGGWVVLPPSVNAKTGFVYKWLLDIPAVEMPDWLVKWCQGNDVSKVSSVKFGPGAGQVALPSHIIELEQRLSAAGSTSLIDRSLKSFKPEWDSAEENRIKSALAALPATCSRDDWLHVGMALHSLDWQANESDRGYELWLEWSRGGGDKFQGEFDCQTRWNSFGKRSGVGLGTLFHYAEKAGWREASAGAKGSDPQGAAVAAEAKAALASGQTNGHAVPLPAAFNLRFDRDKGGNIKATCDNTIEAIKGLGLDCRYDTFHERILAGGQVLQQWAGELSDYTTQKLRNLVRTEFGFDPGALNAHDAAVRVAIEHPFDPVVDYLNGLRWDGTPRLETWLSTYLGAEDSQLTRTIGRLSLIAAVRRAMSPGTKFDQIIVLEGEEGRNKSTAVQVLAGAGNFSDQSILLLDDRAQQEAIQGVWLYEIADLAGMGRADVERIKAFASRDTDRARPAYGRSRQDKPRRCVFFATTNDENYLKSQSGNRRFWPIRVGRIDVAALRADRDQLWAEAVEAEQCARSIMLPESLWGAARQEQEGRREIDPWEMILESVKGTYDEDRREWRISARDVMDLHLRLGADRQTAVTAKRASQAMQRLGWERVKLRHDDAVYAGYRKKRLQ